MSQVHPERRARTLPERWEPFGELDPFSRRMREFLDETLGGLGWHSTQLLHRDGFAPPVDVEELDDAYVVEAELPGVKRDEVTVEQVGNDLLITGETRQRTRTGVVRKSTRRSGRFDYRVTLPAQVAADRIEARLADGVLTVRIPKSERAARKRIEIKAS